MKSNIGIIFIFTIIQLGFVKSNQNNDLSEKSISQLIKEIQEIFATKGQKCLLEGKTEFYENSKESKIREFLEKNIDIKNDATFKQTLNKKDAVKLLNLLGYTEYIFSFCYKKTFLNKVDQKSFEYKNKILRDLAINSFIAHEECIENKKIIDFSSTTMPNIYSVIMSKKKI